MRPLFFSGWPLNFPIRDGVFYYIPYNLGSQSILFISMQIWRSDRPNAGQFHIEFENRVYLILFTDGEIQDTIQDTGYRIQDTGYRIQDTGYRIQDTGYRIQDTGYRIQDTGYRIQDTGYRIQDTIQTVRRSKNRTLKVSSAYLNNNIM